MLLSSRLGDQPRLAAFCKRALGLAMQARPGLAMGCLAVAKGVLVRIYIRMAMLVMVGLLRHPPKTQEHDCRVCLCRSELNNYLCYYTLYYIICPHISPNSRTLRRSRTVACA